MGWGRVTPLPLLPQKDTRESKHRRETMHNTTPLKNKKSKKFTIVIDDTPPWKVSTGHKAYRGGAGIHHDRRLKRLKTRSAQKRAAVGGC